MDDEEGCGNFIGPYPCCSIITGDAKELAQSIPDESVDLIFCDPVYDRIEDYRWLAETAMRVLKDDGACLSWCGIGWLDQTLKALTEGGLSYRWQAILYLMGRVKPMHGDMGFCNYSVLLWYEKGRGGNKKTRDLIGVMPYQDKLPDGGAIWDWSKPADPVAEWLAAFEPRLTLNFFCGGGIVPAVCKMLGRHYLAFEILPQVAETARERVRRTQPPLFVMETEQATYMSDDA